jgi:hypothetical protein
MKASAVSVSRINPAQMRLLHTAVKQLGMDEGTYRDMLRNVAGVSSAKQLSCGLLEIVMEHLKARGFVQVESPAPKKYRRDNPYARYEQRWLAAVGEHRPGMATHAQLALIEALWDEAAPYWNSDGNGDRERSLRGFLRRATGKTEEMRFLTFDQAHSIIEAIKKVRSRPVKREPKANFCS